MAAVAAFVAAADTAAGIAVYFELIAADFDWHSAHFDYTAANFDYKFASLDCLTVD